MLICATSQSECGRSNMFGPYMIPNYTLETLTCCT